VRLRGSETYKLGMNQERITYYQAKLEALLVELREDLKKSVESAQTIELDTSIGRLSRMDAMQSQQMALELRRRQKNQLLRAENALKRIENGTFGGCARCGQPIPEERLEAQPDAVVCIGCANAG
jgi:DnaK suppressor protein